MKEIRGLDERLAGLQQLLQMVQNLRQSQADMAQVDKISSLTRTSLHSLYQLGVSEAHGKTLTVAARTASLTVDVRELSM